MEWISINDAVPDAKVGEVLAFSDLSTESCSKFYIVIYWNHNGIWQVCNDSYTYENKIFAPYSDFQPTHWMPLPKAPDK